MEYLSWRAGTPVYLYCPLSTYFGGLIIELVPSVHLFPAVKQVGEDMMLAVKLGGTATWHLNSKLNVLFICLLCLNYTAFKVQFLCDV